MPEYDLNVKVAGHAHLLFYRVSSISQLLAISTVPRSFSNHLFGIASKTRLRKAGKGLDGLIRPTYETK